MGVWCLSRVRSIPDGSIVGNDNDEDPLKFEPHHSEITSSQEVEIYEPILKDIGGGGYDRPAPCGRVPEGQSAVAARLR